jgi:leader peptidase (prepilin peptidase) / N-methyltransferase
MIDFVTLVAFLAGLLIGSFLNVCIYRLPRDLSIMAPRSYCPHCEHTIAWYDNIPVLSYLFLRGQCRYCQARISLRYPIVELATAIVFAICVAFLGVSLPALKWCLFSAILIALMATDLERRILPDEFTLGGVLLGLIFAAIVPMPKDSETITLVLSFPNWRVASLVESAFGAGIAAGAIWFVVWAYQKIRRRDDMMGFGDVKMIAMMGAFLGAPNTLLSIFVGSAFGAIAGLIYIFVTHKNPSTYHLPFGTFLGAAALAVALAEEVAGIRLPSS